MADKLSSPSSSSNGGSNQTPPKSGPSGSRDDENYLIIRRQPPTHLFSDETFEVHVGLEVSRLTGDSPTGIEVEVTAALHCHRGSSDGTSSSFQDSAILILLNDTTTVSTNKPCRLRCRIQSRESSIRRDKRVLYSLSISTRNPTSYNIASATTTTTQLVNYKLRIGIDSEWNNIWYKDEGGRDKSIECLAELHAKDNTQHRERVPLRLTLCYTAMSEGHDPVSVTNQEILRTLGSSSKLYTDKSTGKATVRFRIEDVSKNHQGQDFVLQVAPDYRKGFFDIAPGFTPSVSVRSKRNKRQRGGGSTTGSSSQHNRRGSSPVEPGQQAPTSSRPFGDTPARTVWGPEGVTTTDPNRLREAMQGIVHWTEEVVNGLYPLQWQILGYAQHPDGSPDYSRPHYSMTNPNACISRVLAMYSESTRENLWILSQAVEQAAANNQRQSSTREPAYGRHSPDGSYSVPPTHRGPPQPPSMPPPVHQHAGAHAHSPPGMHPPPHHAMPGMSVPSGMHPSIASEAFRPKMGMGDPHHRPHQQQQQPHPGLMPYGGSPHGRPHAMHPHAMPPQQYYRRGPVPTQARRGGLDEQDSSLLPEPFPPPDLRAVGVTGSPPSHDGDNSTSRMASYEHHDDSNDASDAQESREAEVEYVLAKEYKALRTGERLGFPAYSASKEILGFYREARTKVGIGEFVPISAHAQDFGPLEILQASDILEEAIQKKSSAVHALKDWGTIAQLLDHALVYDWSKDMGKSSGSDGE